MLEKDLHFEDEDGIDETEKLLAQFGGADWDWEPLVLLGHVL